MALSIKKKGLIQAEARMKYVPRFHKCIPILHYKITGKGISTVEEISRLMKLYENDPIEFEKELSRLK
jgi:hypothetical protein